ncbi:hypothetical protein CDAR_428651 [Caerostris darwini]|uniref:Uncharacterized protein n=1 Tax=Caerostris darwini TaxID=1538125 RepID=A0AAV4RZE9_9ARAC|nr:hypothetical protein CDAR_428651 [Caerostris darwini]
MDSHSCFYENSTLTTLSDSRGDSLPSSKLFVFKLCARMGEIEGGAADGRAGSVAIRISRINPPGALWERCASRGKASSNDKRDLCNTVVYSI